MAHNFHINIVDGVIINHSVAEENTPLIAPYNAVMSVEDFTAYCENIGNVVSPILSIEKNESTYSDWKQARKAMQAAYAGLDWDSINKNEKITVVSWFVEQDMSRVLSVVDIESYSNYAKDFDAKSTFSREKRYGACRMFLFQNFGNSASLRLLSEIQPLITNYIGGLESKSIDNIEGLFDFILSNSGTSFEGNGLAQKSYLPNTSNFGLSKIQIAQKLIDILENGNY